MKKDGRHFDRLTRLLFYVLVGGLVYLALKQIGGLIFILFVSTLTAYVLSPIVDWLEKHRVNRSLGTSLMLLVGTIGAIAFFVWIVPTLVTEFNGAGTRVKAWLAEDHSEMAEWASANLGIEFSSETVSDIKAKIREHAPKALSHVSGFVQSAALQTLNVVGWMLNIVMIPIFVFYILRDFPLMKLWITEHLPLQHRDYIVERASKADTIIGDWLRGQAEVAIIMAVLYSIGLWLVGVKSGVAIGIIAGLLSVVPYLGFAFGLGLALLMAVLNWQGADVLLSTFAAMVGIHLLESYVLAPKIVGERIGLSPMVLLIVLLLGGELFGLMGFILAVPVAGAGKILVLEIVEWYRNSEYFQGQTQIEVTSD